VHEAVKLRRGCEARVMNRVLMHLAEELPDFRDQLRGLGFMKQERHVAKREVVEDQQSMLFTRQAWG
jgi:hypothetical protein